MKSTLNSRRITHLLEELRRNLSPAELRPPTGILRGTAIKARADVISRVLVRITKGFLYLTHPEVDRAQLDFHIVHIDQFKLDSIVHSGVADTLTNCELGEGVYRHWRGLSEDDTRLGLWGHMFYDAAVWMVQHRPGKGRTTLFGAEDQAQLD